MNWLPRIFIVGVTVAAASMLAAAQDGGVQSRSITSDDFSKARPAKMEANAGRRSVTVKPRRYTYKFVRVVRQSPKGGKTPVAIGSPKVTDIGVTVWRLRAPRTEEAGMFLLPVLDDNKDRKMWLAERVSTDTAFAAGDRVRFAVESSDSGYLYVFGRETYADGSMGSPYPVFAASRTGENLVRPGMLFDIPDQREDLPYLRMNPKQTNYTGELLTVIVSPKPLSGLLVTEEGNWSTATIWLNSSSALRSRSLPGQTRPTSSIPGSSPNRPVV
ncbi:MAG: hypothetical protein ABIV21_01110 [Pyrinomonadaceae bacterium]